MKYLAKLFAGGNEILFVKFIINFAGVLKIEYFFLSDSLIWNFFQQGFSFSSVFFGFLLFRTKSPFLRDAFFFLFQIIKIIYQLKNPGTQTIVNKNIKLRSLH